MRRRNQRGFTLIELMVLMLIITLLIGLGLPNYSQSRQRAALEGCKQNLRTLASALQSYQVDNAGKMPLEIGAPGTVTTQSITAGSSLGLALSKYVEINALQCPNKRGTSTSSYGYNIDPATSWQVYCDDSAPFGEGGHVGLSIPARYPRLTNTEMLDRP